MKHVIYHRSSGLFIGTDYKSAPVKIMTPKESHVYSPSRYASQYTTSKESNVCPNVIFSINIQSFQDWFHKTPKESHVYSLNPYASQYTTPKESNVCTNAISSINIQSFQDWFHTTPKESHVYSPSRYASQYTTPKESNVCTKTISSINIQSFQDWFHKLFVFHFMAFFFLLSLSFQIQAAETTIHQLKVQNTTEPLSVEDTHPLFSWQMQSDVRGQQQQAYRIVVVRESDGRTVWDSQKVTSGISNNIKYMGVALQPEMAYSWQLTVWDVTGATYSATSRFETGLMNPKIAAWGGAQWIGSTQPNLDAASNNYFELTTTFQLVKGDKASLVLGANDFRLTDAFQNPDNLSGENYVRVEFDLSGVGTERGAVLNIYRVGYAKSDRAENPFITVSAAKFPQTNINAIFTTANRNNPHSLSINAENSNIYFSINGIELLTAPVERRARSSSGFTLGSSNIRISTATRFNIGPWGNTHDYNTLPHLGQIGFAALPGCEVAYTGFKIKNCGHSIDNINVSST